MAVEPPLFSQEIGDDADKLNVGVCQCMFEADCFALVSPSEAVWCPHYAENLLGTMAQALQEEYEKGVLHD